MNESLPTSTDSLPSYSQSPQPPKQVINRTSRGELSARRFNQWVLTHPFHKHQEEIDVYPQAEMIVAHPRVQFIGCTAGLEPQLFCVLAHLGYLAQLQRLLPEASRGSTPEQLCLAASRSHAQRIREATAKGPPATVAWYNAHSAAKVRVLPPGRSLPPPTSSFRARQVRHAFRDDFESFGFPMDPAQANEPTCLPPHGFRWYEA